MILLYVIVHKLFNILEHQRNAVHHGKLQTICDGVIVVTCFYGDLCEPCKEYMGTLGKVWVHSI